MNDLIAWDLETWPIRPTCIAPPPVCVSFFDEDLRGVYAACEPEFDQVLEYILKDRVSVGHGISYDLAVLVANRPHLVTLVFQAIEDGRVTDTLWREKLKRLATTGELEYETAPDGSNRKIGYHLNDLTISYLGIDRSSEKEDEDAWRVNYHLLDGQKAEDYPEDAYRYAFEDAEYTYRVSEKQGGEIKPEFLTTAAAFALHLQTCWGFAIDQKRVAEKTAMAAELFDESNFQRMIEAQVLRPSVPSRPSKNQKSRVAAYFDIKPNEASDLIDNTPDWSEVREDLEAQGVKFTKPKAASINEKNLHALVEGVCAAHKIEVARTPSGAVCFDDSVQQNIGSLNPVLEEYTERQQVAKLASTELPRIQYPVVHPKYDALKETGRTSSSGSKKGVPIGERGNLYPAVNIQQIDPRVRDCYTAREGSVLCSVDFDFLELVTTAQKLLDLFKKSTLADKINAGFDPHAYLGSRLCFNLDSVFKELCVESGILGGDELYEAFLKLKQHDKDLYKKYRTFAKPTGLGYPGGLGAETFITYAKTTFGVDLVEIAGSYEDAIELAKYLKQLWLEAFPEFEAYFKWVSEECIDREFTVGRDQRYMYQSPMGMVRRNCSYTAATNGAALQTTAAEGAKHALFLLARACYDRSIDSCLYGCHPVAFIHDEVIVEIPEDRWMHERAGTIADIMIAGMREVVTDVKVGAEPTLMRRWDKRAEPVFDNQGQLGIWMPERE